MNKYKPGINLKIELKKGLNNKDLPLPFNLLYNIFREEFLIFKKIFRDLLNKSFIRKNNLEAGALILFIQKPNNSLYFYYNYYTFNIIIRADRYPLLFIREIFYILKGIK